ncbi:MAG: hypothetical protein H8E54_07310, partial [Candidatus Aminicenantes bacterium]|nr:hypothetical protein [Candidatus Aminicenantes bacterium]
MKPLSDFSEKRGLPKVLERFMPYAENISYKEEKDNRVFLRAKFKDENGKAKYAYLFLGLNDNLDKSLGGNEHLFGLTLKGWRKLVDSRYNPDKIECKRPERGEYDFWDDGIFRYKDAGVPRKLWAEYDNLVRLPVTKLIKKIDADNTGKLKQRFEGLFEDAGITQSLSKKTWLGVSNEIFAANRQEGKRIPGTFWIVKKIVAGYLNKQYPKLFLGQINVIARPKKDLELWFVTENPNMNASSLNWLVCAYGRAPPILYLKAEKISISRLRDLLASSSSSIVSRVTPRQKCHIITRLDPTNAFAEGQLSDYVQKRLVLSVEDSSNSPVAQEALQLLPATSVEEIPGVKRAVELSRIFLLQGGSRPAVLCVHKDIVDKISPEDFAEIADIITSEHAIEKNQRSKCSRLKTAILSNITHRQIKGILFDSQAEILRHNGYGRVLNYEYADRNGVMHILYNGIGTPQGGALLSDCIREFIQTNKFYALTREHPRIRFKFPVAWGWFPTVRFKGKMLGFVILGMDKLAASYRGYLSMQEGNILVSQALAFIHKHGSLHRNLHGNNITATDSLIYVHDLETCEDIEFDNLTPEQFLAGMFSDLRYVIHKFTPFYEEDVSFRCVHYDTEGLLSEYLFNGSANVPEWLNSELSEEIEEISASARTRPVSQIKHPLIYRLKQCMNETGFGRWTFSSAPTAASPVGFSFESRVVSSESNSPFISSRLMTYTLRLPGSSSPVKDTRIKNKGKLIPSEVSILKSVVKHALAGADDVFTEAAEELNTNRERIRNVLSDIRGKFGVFLGKKTKKGTRKKILGLDKIIKEAIKLSYISREEVTRDDFSKIKAREDNPLSVEQIKLLWYKLRGLTTQQICENMHFSDPRKIYRRAHNIYNKMPPDKVGARDTHRDTQFSNAAKYARDRGWIPWQDSIEADERVKNPLSGREQDVLKTAISEITVLAEDIADILCLKPHTIRTMISLIGKKLKTSGGLAEHVKIAAENFYITEYDENQYAKFINEYYERVVLNDAEMKILIFSALGFNREERASRAGESPRYISTKCC